MKAKITRPDGTTIEAEGTLEEIAALAPPAVTWTPFPAAIPAPLCPVEWPKAPTPWVITYDAAGVQHWPPKESP